MTSNGPTPAPGMEPRAAARPASRSTRLVLAGGTAVSVACFAVALILEFLGRPTGGGSTTDPAAVAASTLVFAAVWTVLLLRMRRDPGAAQPEAQPA